MNTEEAAKKLLYGHGYNFLLSMHIIRYSIENYISIHEVIQKFKDNKIDLNYAAYISFNGYESFKRLILTLEE